IQIPPLRDRRADIPDLVRHFVEKHAAKLGRRAASVEPDAIDLLTRYAYPGNVRELENQIERAVLLCDPGTSISAAVLPEVLDADSFAGEEDAVDEVDDKVVLRSRTDVFQRNEITAALQRHAGKKTQAARELGITYQGLLKKMRRLRMLE